MTGILDSLPVLRCKLSRWDFWWRKDFEGAPRLDVFNIVYDSFPSRRFVAEMAILGSVNS